jgi:hypothetical protein
MKNTSVLWPFFVGLCFVAVPTVRAQEAWREIVLSDRGKPVPTLKAIAIPATAECNGRRMNAYVVLWGHVKPDGLGYPSLGVLVKGVRDVIPSSEIEQFEGPDLSDAALKERSMDIRILHSKTTTTTTIRTRMVSGGDPFLPVDIRGSEDDFFDMGVWPTKQDKEAWKRLVVDMSSGFDEGHLMIGGPVFSHKLNVEFSGKGIEPLLKRLLEFTGP